MTDVRAARIAEISTAIGDRQLVWFGIRGVDAEPLLVLPQMAACFAITARLDASKLETSTTLEELTGQRVDLDAYDIDLDPRPEVEGLRTAILRSLARPSVVSTYRPSTFLSDITFATRDTARSLGLFKDQQVAFEHKPFVETELEERGVRTVPWRYVPTERRGRIPLGPDRPPVILRPNRSSGGAGIAVVSEHDELAAAWQGGPGQLMGVAPFLADAIPLNVNACVFDPDVISVHPASVQLIGLDGWTTRRFGFCGNDFAAVADLAPSVLDEIDETTRTIGAWLGRSGYRGAFGVDFLLDGDTLYFAEVNARLQGSSRMAASLAAGTGHVDLVLDHLAAFLGLPPTETMTVRDWVAELPASAQVIRHHGGPAPVVAGSPDSAALPAGHRLALAAPVGIEVEPGGVLWCLEVPRRVTETGFDLAPEVEALVPRVVPGAPGSPPW